MHGLVSGGILTAALGPFRAGGTPECMLGLTMGFVGIWQSQMAPGRHSTAQVGGTGSNRHAFSHYLSGKTRLARKKGPSLTDAGQLPGVGRDHMLGGHKGSRKPASRERARGIARADLAQGSLRHRR